MGVRERLKVLIAHWKEECCHLHRLYAKDRKLAEWSNHMVYSRLKVFLEKMPFEIPEELRHLFVSYSLNINCSDPIMDILIRCPVRLRGNTVLYHRASLIDWITIHPEKRVPGDSKPFRKVEEIESAPYEAAIIESLCHILAEEIHRQISLLEEAMRKVKAFFKVSCLVDEEPARDAKIGMKAMGRAAGRFLRLAPSQKREVLEGARGLGENWVYSHFFRKRQ